MRGGGGGRCRARGADESGRRSRQEKKRREPNAYGCVMSVGACAPRVPRGMVVLRVRRVARRARLRADRRPEQLAADTVGIECRRRISPVACDEAAHAGHVERHLRLRRPCAIQYQRARSRPHPGICRQFQGPGLHGYGQRAQPHRDDGNRRRSHLLDQRVASCGRLRRFL